MHIGPVQVAILYGSPRWGNSKHTNRPEDRGCHALPCPLLLLIPRPLQTIVLPTNSLPPLASFGELEFPPKGKLNGFVLSQCSAPNIRLDTFFFGGSARCRLASTDRCRVGVTGQLIAASSSLERELHQDSVSYQWHRSPYD